MMISNNPKKKFFFEELCHLSKATVNITMGKGSARRESKKKKWKMGDKRQ